LSRGFDEEAIGQGGSLSCPVLFHLLSVATLNLSNMLAECFGDLIMRDMAHVASTGMKSAAFQ